MVKPTVSHSKRILAMIIAIAILAVSMFSAVSCNTNEANDEGGVAATTGDAVQNEVPESTDAEIFPITSLIKI